MGRRSILGDYGRTIPCEKHGIPDDQLMTGGQYGAYRGVSRQRVSKNFEQKLIDRFLDSRGVAKYYPGINDEQWQEQSTPHTVSIPTRGQRAAGMDQNDALENAGDFSPYPLSDAPIASAKQGQKKNVQMPQPEDDAATKQTKSIYGKARAKSQLHKAQMDELKVLELQKTLIAREPAVREFTNAAQLTRTRLLSVSDFIIDQLYAHAHGDGDSRTRMTKMRVQLREAIEDALSSVAHDEIERISCRLKN